MSFGVRFRALEAAALVLALLGLGPSQGAARDGPPRVVVSIGPLHSLASAVMAGVAEPYLLMRGTGSPHNYTMTPADARALSRAELVVWVGEALEISLTRPISALAPKAVVLGILDSPGVATLPGRAGGVWQGHDTAQHGEEPEAKGREEAGHDGVDGHVWLDPRNAAALARALAAALRQLDPAHGARYDANAAALADRLHDLERELAAVLAPVRATPYIVFHDAYQYFERRFAMNALGSITIDPARAPGAKRLSEIRARLRQAAAVCVFTEPQFEPALARTAIEGTKARIAVLDPLGADIAPGPAAYVTLLRRMAQSLRDCLAAAS